MDDSKIQNILRPLANTLAVANEHYNKAEEKEDVDIRHARQAGILAYLLGTLPIEIQVITQRLQEED